MHELLVNTLSALQNAFNNGSRIKSNNESPSMNIDIICAILILSMS